ncbi:hypothetical protein LPH43_08830 [Xylella taiwanensis]|uniref:hypothetical protein n=1 Tax=Xylella taiwanensis TaxID=1444770 RepID=UPI0004B69313|nr:hypothetical protein [Xylella taiwanensis]UFM93208.1 hypothetical protein LPH39_08775 [Xylella taiwanensis]UFN01792.1 hypothetical protein LPH43_08830 [Xylella taiwanensis]UFN06261.1 hypothetical protein LPH42_08635 [Xylella taiwanensis]UFN26680.1 hypothetical protein LPH51_08840 [Xylella taiwanensis]
MLCTEAAAAVRHFNVTPVFLDVLMLCQEFSGEGEVSSEQTSHAYGNELMYMK